MAEQNKLLLTQTELPPEQQALHTRCYHRSGAFTEFGKEQLEKSVPERFEQIAGKYPERIALKTEDGALTYGELNAEANCVANAVLADHGSEPEPVALLMEKSAALFATMLGVLKAGNFFIPFDPSLPKARLATGLEDSQPAALVTNRKNASLAKELAGQNARVIEFESAVTMFSTENPGTAVPADALAYVIYTSGSTGQPKGVMQNHRHILHLVMLRTHAYHLCEHDRLAHLTSGTGNTFSNAFVPLLNGAALYSFDIHAHGVRHLAEWLVEERISICPISSPLFRNFAATLTGSEKFPDLRLVRISSDTVYRSDLDLFKKYFAPGCILATGLSSTETGFVTMYLMDHKSEIPIREAPLGYPLYGKEVVLLDDHGKEVACGEVGEIAVRSRYLSLGYWHRPELSSGKFLSEPTKSDTRLYLSGDLGCMLPDGCLLYKGRKDFRVKVRGYGVEFAEVEKALLEHAAVKEAIVTTRQNPVGEAELVAYLTSRQTHLTVSELRAFLEGRVPTYMVPSAFTILDAMPIGANGKIDRRALPAVARARPELDKPFVPPRNALEAVLANIWSEVLFTSPVGIHDRFLDLGGTSLSATRVLARVFRKYQLELPVQALFQSPTIAEMAEVITQRQAKRLEERDLTRILAELESLSDEQVQESLARK